MHLNVQQQKLMKKLPEIRRQYGSTMKASLPGWRRTGGRVWLGGGVWEVHSAISHSALCTVGYRRDILLTS